MATFHLLDVAGNILTDTVDNHLVFQLGGSEPGGGTQVLLGQACLWSFDDMIDWASEDGLDKWHLP